MDAAITPPLRLQVVRADGISSSSTRARLQDFLVHYDDRRRLASHGGDSTIAAQLQKLTEALREERDIRKKFTEK
ncbi:uncharacterized protein C8Q71DRAFT_460127 [Rhodofomes roseus]|uniref:Uncharacterized protein n=1 Tax=Rhodofomes roseus TaxID=34475 RepID=A0ABQ8KNI3_9APHY|nr:uncharacterized protein C8Q71DRAFT_460127 [Rhodofomes roseus]KAH9839710.1 hypothetical protein C8Q71DRAFT_460127 [Rhodofomes roseus]